MKAALSITHRVFQIQFGSLLFFFSLTVLSTSLLNVADAFAQTTESGACDPTSQDCIYEPLQSMACVGANGFLGQINIASIINLQQSDLKVLVQYIDQSGTVRGEVSSSLSPNLKKDFIINDLGLAANTVGSVCVFTNAKSTGAWAGGIALYKPDQRLGGAAFGDGFDFALYYPFVNPRTGPYTLPLNTYHLGTPPEALVANWISISDATPGDGAELSGELFIHDALGKVVAQSSITIADGGRLDFSGHDLLTEARNYDAIGLARFVPKNPSSSKGGGTKRSYYISLTRYFYDCPSGICSNFLTGFNLPLRPPTRSQIYGGTSTVNGELSIVELINSASKTAGAQIKISSEVGIEASSSSQSIAALGTRHVIASEVLGADRVGSSSVFGKSNDLSASSLFYKLDGFNNLSYAYAAPFVGPAGTSQILQFNSFIQQKVDLEVHNSTSQTISWSVQALNFANAPICGDISTKILAGETKRYTLPIGADTYGTVLVASDLDGLITRTYVTRPGAYTLTFPGIPSPKKISSSSFNTAVSCLIPPPTFPPLETCGCEVQGCCSGHGGVVQGCAESGEVYCVDGSVSPSCSCSPPAPPPPPPSPFGPGTHFVGTDIVPGRYYSDPSSGCYWERLSGLGGTFDEIIANEFTGFDSFQLIVDIQETDFAFDTDGDCGFWYPTPRHGFQNDILPGNWLVNFQIAPGIYSANAAYGCYWERLRGFSGKLGDINDNDFVSSAGTQYVSISASDVGFNTDGDCGTWTRVGSLRTANKTRIVNHVQPAAEIESNWKANHKQEGSPQD